MKDILLINPPESYKQNWGIFNKFADRVPPMNLLFLLSYVNTNGFSADMIDCNIERDPLSTILNRMKNEKYKYVGFTVTTPMVQAVCRISHRIKQAFPEVIQLTGGPHPTFLTDDFLDNASIDYVVRGEGEATLIELLENKHVSEIDGLSYRIDSKVIHNKNRELLADLDALPIPEYDRLSLPSYLPDPSVFKRYPVAFIMTSRGCPMRCIFCVGNLMFNKRYRMQSPARMIEECELLIKKFGARQIRFIDDNFTLSNSRIEKFCREMIRSGLSKKIVWSCASRVDSVSDDILQLMKEAGCFMVYFGVESGNADILKRINKRVTKHQVVRAFRLMKKHKIESRASFIIGLPGETKKTVFETINFAKEISPDYVTFTIAIPYPGTELYDIAKMENPKLSNDWSNYILTAGFSNRKLIYCPENISETELKRLQKYCFRAYYLRYETILKKLLKLRRRDEILKYWNIVKLYLMDGI